MLNITDMVSVPIYHFHNIRNQQFCLTPNQKCPVCNILIVVLSLPFCRLSYSLSNFFCLYSSCNELFP